MLTISITIGCLTALCLAVAVRPYAKNREEVGVAFFLPLFLGLIAGLVTLFCLEVPLFAVPALLFAAAYLSILYAPAPKCWPTIKWSQADGPKKGVDDE